MKSTAFGWTVGTLAVLLLAVSISGMAQTPTQFSGLINAYSPQTTTITGTTGPYEVRGPWSLTLSAASGKASFTAALNMELSDGWVLTENGGNFDPNARGAHTHHVTLTNATVTWMTNGFQVSGIATITLNGSPAPVSPSPLVITVTGGNNVKFSNIALTFGSPGSKHFGSEALPGVVQSVN
ncbi:MAG: hypothetical protein WAN69_11620 [Candidatus Korobacteraceae bacterium]|jgi:hypothetical protein